MFGSMRKIGILCVEMSCLANYILWLRIYFVFSYIYMLSGICTHCRITLRPTVVIYLVLYIHIILFFYVL